MLHLTPHRGLSPLFHPLHLQCITLVFPAQRAWTAVYPILYPTLFLIRLYLRTLLYPYKTRISIDRLVIFSDNQAEKLYKQALTIDPNNANWSATRFVDSDEKQV